jgi:hypothetical protein
MLSGNDLYDIDRIIRRAIEDTVQEEVMVALNRKEDDSLYRGVIQKEVRSAVKESLREIIREEAIKQSNKIIAEAKIKEADQVLSGASKISPFLNP